MSREIEKNNPDGSASQAFWRFDLVLDIWQEMASIQTPRSEQGKFIKGLYPAISRNKEILIGSKFKKKISAFGKKWLPCKGRDFPRKHLILTRKFILIFAGKK